MAMEISLVAQLLNDTLNPDSTVVHTATESLDRLSHSPSLPFSLLSISSGGGNNGQSVAAATYLKNFTRRNIDSENPNSKSNVSKEFKDQLMQSLLKVEPPGSKKIIGQSLYLSYGLLFKNSNLISSGVNCEWKTINALTVLQALVRPFQYFLNPKVAKEPVPPQLELIAKEILVPMLSLFHQLVQKALSAQGRIEMEMEKILLIVCKCIYFTVRSHMPSALVPLLPSFCRESLIGLLGSLSFDHGVVPDDQYFLRLKTGKRTLLIFRTLITRHRKYSDKLMPDIINSALKIVRYSTNISVIHILFDFFLRLWWFVYGSLVCCWGSWFKYNPLSKVQFLVIGMEISFITFFHFYWTLHILPALVLNEKDVSEWEEDAEEYIRKTFHLNLKEISDGGRICSTARKSAMNLLDVISLSKGPPMGTF
ncbi:hypothetical protein OIU76_011944 [Salix suchowensis]|nr:hypothetical protein OIU76_011944 [Salix suchowensis]